MKIVFVLCALVAVSSGFNLIRRLAERPGTCPSPSGTVGICIFDPNVNCLSDNECPAGSKCCSEGCGKICKPIVEKREHAGVCPPDSGLVGICMLLPNSCGSDADCSSDHKCCSEGCNRICKPAVDSHIVG